MGLPNGYGREATDYDPFEAHVGWRAGVAAGLAAAVVMGVGMTLLEPSLLRESIAGLYGASGSLAAGWLVHLGHGALFGLVFAVVLADPGLVRVGHRFPGSVVAGLVYATYRVARSGGEEFTDIELESVDADSESDESEATT